LSEGVDAFLDYRREEAKKRVAGSYAYFGFMAIIAGSMFLIRGVLQGYIEISNKKLRRFMVEPIFTDVLPDIVPVACILEVLVPSGVLSYTRACLRPLISCLESRNSGPVVSVNAPITPTASSTTGAPRSSGFAQVDLVSTSSNSASSVFVDRATSTIRRDEVNPSSKELSGTVLSF
jgi:hypothetical protein